MSIPSARRITARLMPLKKLSGSEKAVRCPMPGLVVSLAVAEGQGGQGRRDASTVNEAMKMENVLRAERDGIIQGPSRSRRVTVLPSTP